MAEPFGSFGLDVTYRQIAAPVVADAVSRATVDALPSFGVYGASEVWARARYRGGLATNTATVRLYYYDRNGGFLGISAPLALNATDRLDGAGEFLSALGVDPNPGAALVRAALVSVTTGGSLDLYLGARAGD